MVNRVIFLRRYKLLVNFDGSDPVGSGSCAKLCNGNTVSQPDGVVGPSDISPAVQRWVRSKRLCLRFSLSSGRAEKEMNP